MKKKNIGIIEDKKRCEETKVPKKDFDSILKRGSEIRIEDRNFDKKDFNIFKDFILKDVLNAFCLCNFISLESPKENKSHKEAQEILKTLFTKHNLLFSDSNNKFTHPAIANKFRIAFKPTKACLLSLFTMWTLFCKENNNIPIIGIDFLV